MHHYDEYPWVSIWDDPLSEYRAVQVVWEQVLELEQEQALELLPFPETSA